MIEKTFNLMKSMKGQEKLSVMAGIEMNFISEWVDETFDILADQLEIKTSLERDALLEAVEILANSPESSVDDLKEVVKNIREADKRDF